MLEKNFQKNLIKELKEKFPEALIMKTDPTYIQGLPDILILNGNKWAALECKRSNKASIRPNQAYYISRMRDMSYANFIYPENKEAVLNELQSAL